MLSVFHFISIMSGKTRTRSTAQQLKLLTDYMKTHPRLAQGEFSAPQGRLIENRQWEELRAMLSEHGPDRSVDRWKVVRKVSLISDRTWRDLRRKARTEGSVARRAANFTGNATVVPVLKEQTQKILGIMGTERAFDIQGGEESGIESTPAALSGIPAPYLLIAPKFEPSFHENETFSEVTAQDPSQPLPRPPATEQQRQQNQRARTTSTTTTKERQQRQLLQDPRARENQFFGADLQSNNILKDVANQLAIANRLSAIRSRLAYKEKLWRLRKDVFK